MIWDRVRYAEDFFFAPNLMTIFLHTFQMILRNKKFPKNKNIFKKCIEKIFDYLFYDIFLEPFETHSDLVTSKIGKKNSIIWSFMVIFW